MPVKFQSVEELKQQVKGLEESLDLLNERLKTVESALVTLKSQLNVFLGEDHQIKTGIKSALLNYSTWNQKYV